MYSPPWTALTTGCWVHDDMYVVYVLCTPENDVYVPKSSKSYSVANLTLIPGTNPSNEYSRSPIEPVCPYYCWLVRRGLRTSEIHTLVPLESPPIEDPFRWHIFSASGLSLHLLFACRANTARV